MRSLFAVPDPEEDSPNLDDVIREIAIAATVNAKLESPVRTITGKDIEDAIRDRLDNLVVAYFAELGN